MPTSCLAPCPAIHSVLHLLIALCTPLPSHPHPFPPPFSVLICPLSSQQVAHTGAAVPAYTGAPAAPALHTTHLQLILSLPVEGRGVGVNTATSLRSSPVAMQVLPFKPYATLHPGLHHHASNFQLTLFPLAAYSPALRVCLADGGEGRGGQHRHSARLSPVAVCRCAGTPSGAGVQVPPQVQVCRYPLRCRCRCAGTPSGAGVQVPPQVQVCRYPLRCRCRCAGTPSGAALSVCLAGGGEGGGLHRHFPTPLPCGRAGTRGEGREAALPSAATRESIGLGLASQGTPSGAGVQVPPQVQPLGLQFVTWPPPVAPPLSRLANAVPSLALSLFIPSLTTDQLCVCALQVAVVGGEGAVLHSAGAGRETRSLGERGGRQHLTQLAWDGKVSGWVV
ncbi:unnamed protein product [Closterium sp. NIES-65]|nr:unnamed protein product [Closterium sp. NIES-65]